MSAFVKYFLIQSDNEAKKSDYRKILVKESDNRSGKSDLVKFLLEKSDKCILEVVSRGARRIFGLVVLFYSGD